MNGLNFIDFKEDYEDYNLKFLIIVYYFYDKYYTEDYNLEIWQNFNHFSKCVETERNLSFISKVLSVYNIDTPFNFEVFDNYSKYLEVLR